MNDFDFSGQVAIVTGAGLGLGRCHALALAERGARVVVNDLADADGNTTNADAVVAEISAAGGEAVANGANVADAAQVQLMVKDTLARWGRVDVLINNAGILRDKSFAKMSLEDVQAVIAVHLMGSVHCTQAVWEPMREQGYGRILMTSSASGLYGNFGQTNYSAAKMAVVGMMNTLAAEGAKYNIRVNALAPTAGTRMTEGLLPDKVFELMKPEAVAPAALFLCGRNAPTKTILGAGAGSYAVTRIVETAGRWLPETEQTPEGIAAHWAEISDGAGATELGGAFDQSLKYVRQAAAALGVSLDF